MNPSEPGQGDRAERPWNPLAPLLTWLGLVQEFGTAAMQSVDQAARLSQAQWDMMRDGMNLMSQLPLEALEASGRELARLRAAVHVVQLQMDVFDEQLAAMEQLVGPLNDWADAWRGLMTPRDG